MKNKLSANNKRHTKAISSGSGCNINKPEPVLGNSKLPKKTPPNKRRRLAICQAFKEKIGLAIVVLAILIILAIVTINSAKHNDASADELFTENDNEYIYEEDTDEESINEEDTDEEETDEEETDEEETDEEETDEEETDEEETDEEEIDEEEIDEEEIDEEDTDEEDIDEEDTDEEDTDEEDIDEEDIDEEDTNEEDTDEEDTNEEDTDEEDTDEEDTDEEDTDEEDTDFDNDGEYCNYDEGYKDGYEIGNEEGYELGYELGYTEGYTEGYEEGYNIGYDEGYETAYAEIEDESDEYEDESDENETESEFDEDESESDEEDSMADSDDNRNEEEEDSEPAFVYEKEDKESAKAFLKALNKTKSYILYTNNYKPYTNVNGNIAVVNLLNNLNLLKTNGEGQSYIAYMEEDIYIQAIENATVYVGRDEDDKRKIVKQNTNGKVIYVKEPDSISDNIEECISDISSAASDVTPAIVAENKDAITCVISLLNNGRLKSGDVVAIEITTNDISRVQQLCSKNKDIGANIILNLVNVDEDILTIYDSINVSGNAGTNIVWNFGDYSGAICINSTFTGVIVAPDATVICNAVINGRIIADTVIQGKGIQTPIEQPTQIIDESLLMNWSTLAVTPPVEENMVANEIKTEDNLVINETEIITNSSDFLIDSNDSIIISNLNKADNNPFEIVKTGENTFLILSISGLCIFALAAYWYSKKHKK